MKYLSIVVVGIGLLAGLALSGEADPVVVTDVKAVSHNGQTFVTWKDVAEGEAGARFRYTVYRSPRPIVADLAGAEVCVTGVLNNSARLFGTAFNKKSRLDPAQPTAILEEGGKPLPMWSGLAVVTVSKDTVSYYAVVATDEKGVAVSKPGVALAAVQEKPAPIQPIKVEDSKSRKGPYVAQTSISGKKNLPLHVDLHGSQGQGGGTSGYGDYYLYFAKSEWGWRDGLAGVFSVEERRDKVNRLLLNSRDAIEHPSGLSALETYWFGYQCVPQWAHVKEPRAYPFTERRMLWMIGWIIKKYDADPNRVYCSGGSMGAWGSTTFAFRHPEIFAAVYPNRPRTRQRDLPGLAKTSRDAPVLMDDGKTSYLERMDMVAFAAAHHDDLPFYGWCCGRRDGFASWQEQVDMVRALTAARHGFAFAWNDGDHSTGAEPMKHVLKFYPPDRFARNVSYPAFSKSSIDNDPGPGDPKAGDREGGINLGFRWKDVVDEKDQWTISLANGLATQEMTVDVTPRRCQNFKVKAGETFQWTNSAGGAGKVVADAKGLVTVERVKILPKESTTLTLRR